MSKAPAEDIDFSEDTISPSAPAPAAAGSAQYDYAGEYWSSQQNELTQPTGFVQVEAELRLAISDESGKMLSFLSGGAKVQVPRNKFNASFLPEMRRFGTAAWHGEDALTSLEGPHRHVIRGAGSQR